MGWMVKLRLLNPKPSCWATCMQCSSDTVRLLCLISCCDFPHIFHALGAWSHFRSLCRGIDGIWNVQEHTRKSVIHSIFYLLQMMMMMMMMMMMIMISFHISSYLFATWNHVGLYLPISSQVRNWIAPFIFNSRIWFSAATLAYLRSALQAVLAAEANARVRAPSKRVFFFDNFSLWDDHRTWDETKHFVVIFFLAGNMLWDLLTKGTLWLFNIAMENPL